MAIPGRDDGNAFTSQGSDGSKAGLVSGCMHSIDVGSLKMLDLQIASRVSHAPTTPSLRPYILNVGLQPNRGSNMSRRREGVTVCVKRLRSNVGEWSDVVVTIEYQTSAISFSG